VLRFSTGKTVAILLTILFGFVYATPSLLSEGQRRGIESALSWMPSWLVPSKAIVLGLDLQGGSHVVLQVETQAVSRGLVVQLRDDVRRVLRETRVGLQGGIALGQRGVQVRIPDAADRARVLPRLRELGNPIGTQIIGGAGIANLEVTEGEGGLLSLTLTDAGINEKVRRSVEQSIEVLRRRVDALGTTEPNIQRQGLDRVLVQVPGLQDPQRLKEILGKTAQLQFRMLADPGAAASDIETMVSKETGGNVQVERRVIVQGEDLIDAQPGFDQRTAEPIVNFRFNVRGAQRFGQVTTENVGRLLAIVLDGEVISAPRILQPITGGSGQISGRFTVEAANNLAILLRAGALPAPLTIIEERTVGPGLGQDSIEAGKLAAMVGSLAVVVFMVAAYGFFGVIATVALVVNVVLLFAVLSLLGATLTLPGIAGIVLTVGMAVDSNVLIYERVREENRLGRSTVSSLDTGFARALATILDANLTTLIAAAVLFLLGTGPVRGFAVTLSIGIVTTVFTAYTFTRLMVALWYRTRRPQHLSI
jgi:preprotein translocase subunit SecD